jgi:hypothetical protein
MSTHCGDHRLVKTYNFYLPLKGYSIDVLLKP